MELTHWRLTSNYTWNVESELFHALLQINEDHVGEYLKSVPATIDDNLRSIPQLAAMAHARLGQLVLVDLGLEPLLLFCVEDKQVVYDALATVAFSSTKYNEVLAELRR